jgi:calcineurin-like phosphoesterase family protein
LRTLVIPDIHENIEWANAVLALKAPQDRAVFLGDYFHQFNQDRTGAVCVWLKEMMARDDVSLLLGNHDQAHIGASLQILDYLCGGYCGQKQLVFQAHFPRVYDFTDHVQLWATAGPGDNRVLLTHAGVTRCLAEETLGTLDYRKVIRRLFLLESDLARPEPQPWLLAGKDRGGDQEHGGVTWCDWLNFEPIPGIRQICGHTSSHEVRRKGDNWCIDTGQTHYAWIEEDGAVTIEKLPKG